MQGKDIKSLSARRRLRNCRLLGTSSVIKQRSRRLAHSLNQAWQDHVGKTRDKACKPSRAPFHAAASTERSTIAQPPSCGLRPYREDNANVVTLPRVRWVSASRSRADLPLATAGHDDDLEAPDGVGVIITPSQSQANGRKPLHY